MPEGATGKDANGNYTKVENGMQVTWNTELQTWERHLNVNDQDIPLIVWNQAQHKLGIHDQVLLSVRISDKVKGFDKVESISLHPGVDIDLGNYLNFSNQFLSDVIQKYIGSSDTTDPRWFSNGEISFSFTTSERPDPWVWKLGPGTKVIVDILDKPIGNGFTSWNGDAFGNHLRFQVRMFTDPSTGDLHVWFALSPGVSADQITDEEWKEIFVYGPGQVLQNSDQRVPDYSARLTNYVELLTKPQYPPFTDFSPPQ